MIAASTALYCVSRKGRVQLRRPRIQWRRHKSTRTVAQSIKQVLANDIPASPIHTAKTAPLSEVVYNIPLSRPWSPESRPISAAETPRLPPGLKRSKSSAATTVSDVFARSWKYVSTAVSRPTSGEWRQREITFGPRLHPDGTVDVEWQPPTNWDVVGDEAQNDNTYIPPLTLPLPVVTKQPMAMREVDPSTFPVPRYKSLLATRQPSRASRPTSALSQATGTSIVGRSSIAGDSIFCTCDLDQPIRDSEDRVRDSIGSSIQLDTEEGFSTCRACNRRSMHRNRASMSRESPMLLPLEAGFGLTVKSTRRSKRRKRLEEAMRAAKSKTIIAGRLYQRSEGRVSFAAD